MAQDAEHPSAAVKPVMHDVVGGPDSVDAGQEAVHVADMVIDRGVSRGGEDSGAIDGVAIREEDEGGNVQDPARARQHVLPGGGIVEDRGWAGDVRGTGQEHGAQEAERIEGGRSSIRGGCPDCSNVALGALDVLLPERAAQHTLCPGEDLAFHNVNVHADMGEIV